MRKQSLSQPRGAAILIALALCHAGAAAAQDVCIGGPNSAPGTGTDGAPKWLSTDPHGGSVNHWMNDIRWSDTAPDLFGDLKDDATYRVMYDNEYLLVSIQAAFVAGDKTPNNQSRVYFAVGHENNDKAVAVAINLRAPSTAAGSANSPTAVTDAQTFIKDDAQKACVGGSNPGTACTAQAQCLGGGLCKNNWRQLTAERGGGKPAWLVAPAVWVNENQSGKFCVNDMDTTTANKNNKPCVDANGDGQADSGECGSQGGVCVANDPSRSLWGANFKIKLSGTDGVGLPTADPLRMFVGSRLVAVTPMAARIYKRLPLSAVTSAAGDSLFDTAVALDAMVPRDMATWGVSTAPTQRCDGASLVRSKIGHQTTAGNFDLVDLNISATSANTLVATAECPTGCPAGSLKAKFRVANWGSNFNDLGWSPLIDRGGLSEITMSSNKTFRFDCPDNIAGLSTCGLLNTGLNAPSNGYYHQCMAVDISPPRDSQVKVSAGSEYVNTRFEMASTIQRVATIDVRGLQARTGNSAARNIYMFVTRKNMPATTTKKLYLPRGEMVGDRLEALDMYSCSSQNPDVSCVALDGPVGLCAYPCDAQGFCDEGDTNVDIDDQCFCTSATESSVDVCYAGQPDGRDLRNTPGVDARIERSWPTYDVLTYFDTGKTVTTGGVTYKVLETMTEFGMYVDHVGAHHGFTDSLVGLNGLAVTKVATDVYRITVPNEGKATMRVTVTAQEDSSVVPLTVISGTATDFGIFGAVEVVGVSPVVAPLDLRRATARLNRLMSENGRELVRNLNAPRTLSPLPGALPTIATFLNTTGVDVSMEVIELPLLGRLTTTTAAGASVDKPAACPFAIGVAKLSTSFSINDTVNPVFATEAINDWACIPFVGMLAL